MRFGFLFRATNARVHANTTTSVLMRVVRFNSHRRARDERAGEGGNFSKRVFVPRIKTKRISFRLSRVVAHSCRRYTSERYISGLIY